MKSQMNSQIKSDSFEKKLFKMAGQEKMAVPDSLQIQIDDILVGLPKKRRIFHMTWKKSVLLAAALTCMLSITVTAAVSLLQQRMEAMNQKEIEAYFVQIYTSKMGMDNYNRPITETERKRMEELRNSYEKEALFPKKTLTMIDSPDEYKGRGVAFCGDTSTFFLPEKEMSDEELLQIIDFRYKRDYSLQKMNEEIAAGETEFPTEEITKTEEPEATDEALLQSDAIWNPGQELTIPYTGNLEIKDMFAGQNAIFLTGWSSIHTMEIGSGKSEVFFDDFKKETYISALYQCKNGDVYVALMERADGADHDVMIGGKTYKMAFWILSAQGELKRKIELSGEQNGSMVRRMVVDDEGNIYVRMNFPSKNSLIQVYDKDGKFIKRITSEIYTSHALGGLGIGKDGKVYTQIESVDIDGGRFEMGIASVNLEKGTLEDVYMGIVPEGTIMLDIIAPGAETDFVFWGYDGIFTYNLKDKSAVNVLPAYEAPCEWEGCLYCALPDGRIVFGGCSEYRIVEEEQRSYRIPEKTCFYYKPALPK